MSGGFGSTKLPMSGGFGSTKLPMSGFRIVLAVGRFGHVSRKLSAVGHFGLILRWVVSAYFGWLFQTDIPLIFYNIN